MQANRVMRRGTISERDVMVRPADIFAIAVPKWTQSEVKSVCI
jgi:hypothetical protein